MFLQRLMAIIMSESDRISYERREIALDCICQLWRLPGFISELFINYDCDIYCTNLLEQVIQMLSKKTSSPTMALSRCHMLSTQIMALEALMFLIQSIALNAQPVAFSKMVQNKVGINNNNNNYRRQ